MLTPKQAAFVREYMIDLNATQAVLRAGYRMTEAAAAVHGSKLLRNAKIQEAIRAARQAQEARTQITSDRVLRELAEIAFADVADYLRIEGNELMLLDSEQIPEAKRRAIQGYRRGKYGPEVVLADKLKALELLGRYLGLWEKRQEDEAHVVHIVFEDGMEAWAK